MNYNLVVLVGRLTRDPELTYTPSNVAICKFGLAVNHKFKEKEEVCYVDITMFGTMGETLNKHATKGSPLLVQGRLSFNQWTSKDGTKKSKLEVIADRFQFMGDKKREDKTAPDGDEPAF